MLNVFSDVGELPDAYQGEVKSAPLQERSRYAPYPPGWRCAIRRPCLRTRVLGGLAGRPALLFLDVISLAMCHPSSRPCPLPSSACSDHLRGVSQGRAS